VRDGINLARRGIPTVALVTEKFWEQGRATARAEGMPDAPRLCLPHPVAGSGPENMARIATEIAPVLLQMLRGDS
jgi:hypothetical protein